jgi:phosphohistidine phosphatase
MPNRLRELLIIRHAKSDWSGVSLQDKERPLAEKGKKQACKMGYWLANNDLIPDLILVSPTTRTQQTLSRLIRHWPQKPHIIEDELLYNASKEALIECLKSLPSSAHRVALLGHNPGLEALLAWLSGQPDTARLTTCAIAQLILPEDWSELEAGTAKLIQVITPKQT